jgi:hypothetical protein
MTEYELQSIQIEPLIYQNVFNYDLNQIRDKIVLYNNTAHIHSAELAINFKNPKYLSKSNHMPFDFVDVRGMIDKIELVKDSSILYSMSGEGYFADIGKSVANRYVDFSDDLLIVQTKLFTDYTRGDTELLIKDSYCEMAIKVYFKSPFPENITKSVMHLTVCVRNGDNADNLLATNYVVSNSNNIYDTIITNERIEVFVLDSLTIVLPNSPPSKGGDDIIEAIESVDISIESVDTSIESVDTAIYSGTMHRGTTYTKSFSDIAHVFKYIHSLIIKTGCITIAEYKKFHLPKI